MKNEDSGTFQVANLGAGRTPSPVVDFPFVRDDARVPVSDELREPLVGGQGPPAFEMAGPRKELFFDPRTLKCAIVTCGGLCPGLNNVIRAIVRCLVFQYGVKTVLGIPYGYEGLAPKFGHRPVELTPEKVDLIHEAGGTILGSSRGNQDVSVMVDSLQALGVDILFTVGGDGTLRGAHAIAEEAKRRDLQISVIGVPKTIDNDISYVQTSFGFETAVAEARRATNAAHIEATGYRIRSLPANSRDAAFCLLLGQCAVHAGMAGKTDMVVGYWANRFTHVPISLAVSSRKKVDINGFLWNSVLASTGQPRHM